MFWVGIEGENRKSGAGIIIIPEPLTNFLNST